MSNEEVSRTLQSRIETAQKTLGDLRKAVTDQLEEYIEGLDEDEQDLAYDGDDEQNENTGARLEKALNKAEITVNELDGEEGPEAAQKLADLAGDLDEIEDDLESFKQSLKDQGIEP